MSWTGPTFRAGRWTAQMPPGEMARVLPLALWMFEAVIIGPGLSTPGPFSSRRRVRRLHRGIWRWTLAFNRRPPGSEVPMWVKYVDCSLKPGGG
jgi:hypothetical protein